MGVCVTNSTMLGAVTPTCNSCGVSLCWDIGEDEYNEAKNFWDNWCCKECCGGRAMSLKAFMRNRSNG